MVIAITSISLCVGTGHATIVGTVGGNAISRTFRRTDLAIEPDDTETAVLARLRSAVKEAGASTLAQIKTALEGKTFQV